MAASKLEIPMSQLVHKIASKFQRLYLIPELYLCFPVQLSNGTISIVVRSNEKELEVKNP